MPIAHLTMEGLNKFFALVFSICLHHHFSQGLKIPNRKGRTEKAAPMSKRKFTSLSSICRVTQGLRGMIWISLFAGVSRATGHHQSQSPRTNTEGAGVYICKGLYMPSLREIWTLLFAMSILSAAGILGMSQL